MKRNEVDGYSLDRALLRLLPDIFFHPVWTYFARPDCLVLPDHILSLQHTAEELAAQGEVGSACQVWLSCAARQCRVAESAAALESIQQALSLAERYTLPHATCWAAWGGSAVCARRGDFQQAVVYLQRLADTLHLQHEWILANVIDVIQQRLLNQASCAEPAEAEILLPLLLDSTLQAACEQLLHWGEPPSPSGSFALTAWQGRAGLIVDSPAAGFTYRWRHFWQRVKKVIKGELHLQWAEVIDHRPSRVPDRLDERWIIPAVQAPAPAPDPIASTTPQPGDAPEPLEQLAPIPSSEPEPVTETSAVTPTLTVYTMGTFHLAVNDVPTNQIIVGKSRTIFEYLLIHHHQPIARDALMDIFWPNAEPDSARNRLNVSLHHVRQALRTVTDIPIVLFEDGAYRINPELDVWIDAEEFDRHARKGRQLEAATRLQAATKEYELARDVYQGDFLADEPYEDWPVLIRERLRANYLDTLDRLSQIYFDQGAHVDCAALCQSILAHDNCREDAHCRLMQCYSRQNQRYLALRQYQVCVTALRTELEVDPAPSTTQLFERIRRRERI